MHKTTVCFFWYQTQYKYGTVWLMTSHKYYKITHLRLSQGNAIFNMHLKMLCAEVQGFCYVVTESKVSRQQDSLSRGSFASQKCSKREGVDLFITDHDWLCLRWRIGHYRTDYRTVLYVWLNKRVVKLQPKNCRALTKSLKTHWVLYSKAVCEKKNVHSLLNICQGESSQTSMSGR